MKLSIEHFANAHAHLRDVGGLPCIQSILVIGPGLGLDVAVLRWAGYKVMTMDNDPRTCPDWLGSVEDGVPHLLQFDCIIASPVLEHIALALLPRILTMIAARCRYALIYLPMHGKQLKLTLHKYAYIVDLPIGPNKDPQHYWEIGNGATVPTLTALLGERFTILRQYRNREWPASYNFVLKTKGGF